VDVVRAPARHALPWRRIVSIVVLLLAATGAMWSLAALARVRGDAPAIDRATIITDRATRGPLVLTVPAQGVFAAERVRVIAAPQAGVVDSVFVKDGAFVHPGTLVARLDNPALVRALGAARSALAVETANLESEREQSRASDHEPNRGGRRPGNAVARRTLRTHGCAAPPRRLPRTVTL